MAKPLARRRRRLLRPHLDRRRATPRSALVPGRVRRRRAARTPATRAEVWVDGTRRPVRGRVCMDQFVVDLGDDDAAGRRRGRALRPGRPTASPPPRTGPRPCGTINYEIVTRIGGRLARRHVDGEDDARMSDHARTGPRRSPPGRAGLAAAGAAVRRRPPAPRSSPTAARATRTPFGSLRSAPGAPSSPTTASTSTSRSTSSTADGDGRRAPTPTLTVVFVHGYSLNLDCWHFQRAAYRGQVRTVFYDQRSHGRSGALDARPRHHRAARPRPADASSTTVVPQGAGRAGRPLDGRDDDHRAGRAAPRAVRRPGRRRRA